MDWWQAWWLGSAAEDVVSRLQPSQPNSNPNTSPQPWEDGEDWYFRMKRDYPEYLAAIKERAKQAERTTNIIRSVVAVVIIGIIIFIVAVI